MSTGGVKMSPYFTAVQWVVVVCQKILGQRSFSSFF